MKKPSKGLAITLSSVFVVLLFIGVVGAMAVAGKINVSGVPVIGNVIEALASQDKSTDGTAISDEEAVEVSYKVAATSVASSEYTSISDVAVGSDGAIYAADETGMKLYKLTSDGKIDKTYSSDSAVNAVTVGSKVYVMEGGLAGTVSVLDPATLTKTATIEVGHTPCAMTIDGDKGYVANRFSNTVSAIDLNSNTVFATIDINGREPDALTLANGKIYVACHLPDDSSRESVISANVCVIDISTSKVVKTIDLVNGAGGVKGICASPDGSTVYVSHVIARYGYPTTQLDRGWINTNGFSIINTTSDETSAAVLLDEVEMGAANPWGIAVNEDGSKLICNISGTDEVMVVDIAKMNAKIDAVKNGTGVVANVSRITDYLPFLDDCRTRISLDGKGAREIAVSGNNAYIGLYFDGSVDVLNLSDNSVAKLSFATQPEADEVRAGQILFSDANKCYQKWQSCLSCHPDARVDGFNWDNMNDGLGNPKSAKSMLYSHRTPPVMSTGIRASAELAVRAGMKFIQFNVLDETEMSYIDEYLKSLLPVASPYLNRDGTLTASAQNGKALFESKGCAECHPAPLYTDLKTHTSKTTEDDTTWENRKMDTPTMVEVWRTGPWVFDGRFNNMKEAVTYYADGLNLTDTEITDLSNFVLSIGAEGEQYGIEEIYDVKDGKTTLNAIVPGGEISSFGVRCQQKDAPADAVITVTLAKADKTVIATKTANVAGMSYNTVKLAELNSAIKIPNDIASGATLTLSITDKNGNKLATDLVIKY